MNAVVGGVNGQTNQTYWVCRCQVRMPNNLLAEKAESSARKKDNAARGAKENQNGQ